LYQVIKTHKCQLAYFALAFCRVTGCLENCTAYMFVNGQFSLGIEPVYECSKILDEKAAKQILFIQISYK